MAPRSESAYLREKEMTSLRSTTRGVVFLLPDPEPADREIKDGRVNKLILLCIQESYFSLNWLLVITASIYWVLAICQIRRLLHRNLTAIYSLNNFPRVTQWYVVMWLPMMPLAWLAIPQCCITYEWRGYKQIEVWSHISNVNIYNLLLPTQWYHQ